MSKPVKVLYVHRSVADTYGGALVELLRVLERLDRRAFEPVALLTCRDVHAERFRALGVRTIHVPIPPFRKGKSIPRIPFVIGRLVRLLRRERIDLVHVNDADDAAIVGFACRWIGIPCVVHSRSEMEPAKFRKLWVHRADAVIAVSEAVRRAAVTGGVDASRTWTAYSGCDAAHIERLAKDFSVRDRLGIASSAVVVGCVANLVPKKGHRYLIEALGIVSRGAPIVGLIVGADECGLQRDLAEAAAAAGLGDRVRFVGFQENVYPFISAMDVFVLASLDEGFGIVLLEAMALGKPVIATDVHGPPEIVLSGTSGVIVPPKDGEALAEALSILIRDPSLRTRMGAMGQARVRENFSLDATARRWEAVYRSLVNTGGENVEET